MIYIGVAAMTLAIEVGAVGMIAGAFYLYDKATSK